MSESGELRELYQEMILDHGRHPRHFRKIDDAECEAVGHNPLCGDRLVLFIKIGEDGRIADAAFQGEGCAISMASASLMTDMLKGKTAPEVKALWAYFEALTKDNAIPEEDKKELDKNDIDRLAALSGVKHYPVRVKCATLAWRTLEAALDPKATKKVGTE